MTELQSKFKASLCNLVRPYLKIKSRKKDQVCNSVVERLPSMYEVLGSCLKEKEKGVGYG